MTTTPTPTAEQIEAVAIACVNSHRDKYGMPPIESLDEVPNPTTWRRNTRAALEAAKLAAPAAPAIAEAGSEPSDAQVERIARILARTSELTVADAREFVKHAQGLAAAPAIAVDEGKIAEVIEDARRRWDGSGRHEPIATAITRDVLKLLRGQRL